MLGEQSLIGIVPTLDAAESRGFYEGVLGLEFVSEDRFAVVMRSGPNSIRLVKLESHTPQPFTILGWHSNDVPALARELGAKGVVFERFEGMEQDELGVWHPPGGGNVAWFKDPDGNLLSLSGS